VTIDANRLDRRTVLRLVPVLAGLGGVLHERSFAQARLKRTPDQILGPFYPVTKTPDLSGDLTRLPGHAGRAKGQPLVVSGRVMTTGGEPLVGARVEVWQANAVGRYAHPDDANPAPLDPDFEGFGAVMTDAEGRYRFKTIKPAAYPTGPNSFRPAHIHFQVQGPRERLVTQMYFEGDPYNEKDRFLQSAGRPEALIVKLREGAEDGAASAPFDIILASSRT